jgi:primosomal replication protein N
MNFAVEHQSEQSEGDNRRRIVLNMDCVVFGEMAVKFESVDIGEKIHLSGFLE